MSERHLVDWNDGRLHSVFAGDHLSVFFARQSPRFYRLDACLCCYLSFLSLPAGQLQADEAPLGPRWSVRETRVAEKKSLGNGMFWELKVLIVLYNILRGDL